MSSLTEIAHTVGAVDLEPFGRKLSNRLTYHGEGREGVVFSSRLGASPRTGRVVKWEEILASNSGKRRKPLDMMA